MPSSAESPAPPAPSREVGGIDSVSLPALGPDPIRGEFSSPSPIPLGNDFLVGGAFDLRYRSASFGRTDQVWINDAEIQIQHPITQNHVKRGNVKIQIIGEDPPDIAGGRDIQLGEAYILYKIPLGTADPSSAYVKLGQFQLPFALLAEYDPHLDLVQPLYSQSLGLRNDWGIAVSGRFYGYLTYDLSITSGSGPNHVDIDPNRLVIFRLGRSFVTRNGQVNVGGSLLSGRLPVTDIDANNLFANELPPSGRVRPEQAAGFISKSRIAGDGTYTYKSIVARGEMMAGADGDNRVLGYFLSGNYKFTRRASVIVARSYWLYPLGDSSSAHNTLGLSYELSRTVKFRTAYEDLLDIPSNLSGNHRTRITYQLLIQF